MNAFAFFPMSLLTCCTRGRESAALRRRQILPYISHLNSEKGNAVENLRPEKEQRQSTECARVTEVEPEIQFADQLEEDVETSDSDVAEQESYEAMIWLWLALLISPPPGVN